MFKKIFLLFSFLSIIISYLVFDSMVKQSTVVNDLAAGKVSYQSKDLQPFFTLLPNISTTTIPLDNYLAYYLWKEGQISESINLYKGANHINPYLHFSDYMLAQIYFSKKDLDSALHFAEKAFYGWPKKIEHYEILNDILVEKKDTISLIKAFDFISEVFNDRSKYKNDFVQSFASAKIKYLKKYKDLNNVPLNKLLGTWQRVLEFETGEIKKYRKSTIVFDNDFYFSNDQKFSYSLTNDSIFLYPLNNNNYVITKFQVKFSQTHNSLIINSKLPTGEIDSKVFKKNY